MGNDNEEYSPPNYVQDYEVRLTYGLHSRPATLVAQKANDFINNYGMEWAMIYDISNGSEGVELHSMLKVMSLGAIQGTKVKVEACLPEEHRDNFHQELSDILQNEDPFQ